MKTPRDILEFFTIYPTEAACLNSLIESRWPDGFRCPTCDGTKAYWVRRGALYECAHCGQQTSPTAGTIFHKTKTSLQKWFLAIYFLSATKKAMSASELARQLRVAYATAWTMRRKIVHAMTRRDGELMLHGRVELDETLLGGYEPGQPGRGSDHKAVIAIAVERTSNDKGCRLAHFHVVPDASQTSLVTVATATIVSGSTVLTDGWASYQGLSGKGYKHLPKVLGSPENAVKVLPWAHVLISNFKRWIVDIFHGVSAKHLQAYLDEFCYRLNRRWQRTDIFRHVLNRCAKYTAPVSYAQLTTT
jgi:transposase-like protein